MYILWVLFLSFCQNVSFSMLSRSRNRDNMTYHLIASVFSNGIWFLTVRELVASELSWDLAAPYIAGTVAGSVCGVKLSMLVESSIVAKSDSHID